MDAPGRRDRPDPEAEHAHVAADHRRPGSLFRKRRQAELDEELNTFLEMSAERKEAPA
jgi:hypothetical protein